MPKKRKHMRVLARLDYYLLMPLRSGADKTFYENCQFGENRLHLINCDKYSENQPEQETIFDDKKSDKWQEWWRKYKYLGIGILMNLVDKIDRRVMLGNPLDRMITITIQ